MVSTKYILIFISMEYVHPSCLKNPDFEIVKLKATPEGISDFKLVSHFTMVTGDDGWDNVFYLRYRPISSQESSLKNKNGGYVYIFTNPGYPGICKIGFTTSSIKQRLNEINNAGSLIDWEDIFKFKCKRPYDLEQAVHRHMSHLKARNGKEFFIIEIDEAIKIISSIGKYYGPIYG